MEEEEEEKKESWKPRWKSKEAESVAKAEPMSGIIDQLQRRLQECQAYAIMARASCALLKVRPDVAYLLNRSCFGVPIIAAPPASISSLRGTRAAAFVQAKQGKSESESASESEVEKGKEDWQWFQLSLEEAFYLCYCLNCLTIARHASEGLEDLSHQDIWKYMNEVHHTFLHHFKVYAHLRAKNWVVRSGLQFGADFVAYHHHPGLVHSEYAVIVSLGNACKETRLTTWSDWQSTLRLCGSVAKTLLVLNVVPISENISETLPSCLDHYKVEEFEIRRWMPERHRENK